MLNFVSSQNFNIVYKIFRNAITTLQTKLQQWGEYEALRDECMSWLRDTDSIVHAIDLKSTLDEKREQSDLLKVSA